METPGVSGTRLRKLRPLFGRSCTRPLVEIGGTLHAARFQNRRLGRDRNHLFHLRDVQRQGEGNRLANRQVQAFANQCAEIGGLGRDFVRPQRQQQPAETAFVIA